MSRRRPRPEPNRFGERRYGAAAPNVEYLAPWFRSGALVRSMSFERGQTLSPHAQRTSRFVVCDRGETVVGDGFSHPRSAEREAYRDAQLDALGEQSAAEYLRRS